MTSYRIMQGYAPDHMSELQDGELLEIAKEVVTVKRLAEQMQKYGVLSSSTAWEEAGHYATIPTEDLRLQESDGGNLVMAASSMAGRDTREAACRAVVALVLDEAYARGRSVQVSIS